MGRRYRKPPVVEALCEILFSGSRWDTTIPGIFYSRVRGEFPVKTQLDEVGMEIQLSGGQVGTRMGSKDPRIRFSREDGSRIVQLGRNLLVVNQLRPYPHFEQWRPVVSEMVAAYRDLTAPVGVERIGVRYINRVVIPEPEIRMERFFKLYPEVPPDLGAAHGEFLMRLQIPPHHADHQLIVTFATTPAAPETGLGYLLDLYDIAPMGERYSFDKLESRLEEAHTNVEHSFESSITDALRALFEEVTK